MTIQKCRRIEIVAFQRRVTLTSGGARPNGHSIHLRDVDSEHSVSIESPEGRQILAETLRLLEDLIARPESEQRLSEPVQSTDTRGST